MAFQNERLRHVWPSNSFKKPVLAGWPTAENTSTNLNRSRELTTSQGLQLPGLNLIRSRAYASTANETHGPDNDEYFDISTGSQTLEPSVESSPNARHAAPQDTGTSRTKPPSYTGRAFQDASPSLLHRRKRSLPPSGSRTKPFTRTRPPILRLHRRLQHWPHPQTQPRPSRPKPSRPPHQLYQPQQQPPHILPRRPPYEPVRRRQRRRQRRPQRRLHPRKPAPPRHPPHTQQPRPRPTHRIPRPRPDRQPSRFAERVHRRHRPRARRFGARVPAEAQHAAGEDDGVVAGAEAARRRSAVRV